MAKSLAPGPLRAGTATLKILKLYDRAREPVIRLSPSSLGALAAKFRPDNLDTPIRGREVNRMVEVSAYFLRS